MNGYPRSANLGHFISTWPKHNYSSDINYTVILLAGEKKNNQEKKIWNGSQVSNFSPIQMWAYKMKEAPLP